MSIKQAIEALESVVAYDENDAQDGLELMLLYAKAMEQARAAIAALRSMPAPIPEPVDWQIIPLAAHIESGQGIVVRVVMGCHEDAERFKALIDSAARASKGTP